LRVGAEIETWQDDRLIRLLYRANTDLVAQRDASVVRQYRKDSIAVVEEEIQRLQKALGLQPIAITQVEKVQETKPLPPEMADFLPESSDEQVPSASAE
jgi:hypothetical protein